MVTAFACAASGLTAWAALDLFFPEPELSLPRYLVTKRPLSKGLPVSFADLTFEHRASNEICPTALTDQQLDFLKGAVLTEDLGARAPLCSSQLDLSARLIASNRIPRGQRGFVFRPANALPLQGETAVDILVHPEREAELPYVAVVNARLLQVVRSGRGRAQDLFVAVPAGKIPLLEKAAERGKLSVALRNPDDREESGESVSRPKKSSRQKSFQTSVEIISEGE